MIASVTQLYCGSCDRTRLTADGEVVVIHDDTAQRVAEPGQHHATSPIAELTLEEVRAIELVDGHTISTLDEVLDSTTTRIQVEIKDPRAVTPLVKLYQSRPLDLERTLFISFSLEALTNIAASMSQAQVAYLVNAPDDEAFENAEQLIKGRFFGILPPAETLNSTLVARCHALGWKVGCWTARDEETLVNVLKAGVDAVTVSDPIALRPVDYRPTPGHTWL